MATATEVRVDDATHYYIERYTFEELLCVTPLKKDFLDRLLFDSSAP
jgi:hypothetical protein